MFTRTKSAWKVGAAVDFCSNDLLSLGVTGQLRTAFLEELASHPNFALYAGGSRLMDGNYDYIEEVEQEIADFHGAETALIVNSGYEGNCAIYTAIPRPGDAIVYATARFTSTTGDWVSWARASYSAVMRVQSVSAGVRARAWQAAIAAWSA